MINSGIDKLKNVKPGDPISAEQANLIRRLLRREVTGPGVHADSTGWHVRPSARLIDRTVIVKNDSGSNLGQFAVLGIDDPVYSPDGMEVVFEERVRLEGVVPDEDVHRGRFVVLLEPANDGKDALAVVSGVVQVHVSVSDEAHEFADMVDGEMAHLKSGIEGAAQILWKETGTGVKWAVVRIGNLCYDVLFPARIGVATPAGDNRWTYAFVEVEKTVAGYDGWTTLSGGRTGTVYNSIEDMNSDAGVQGNGVDLANLDTAEYTFTIQPCPEGNVVWIRTIRFIVGETPTVEYWFGHENGVDGSCD